MGGLVDCGYFYFGYAVAFSTAVFPVFTQVLGVFLNGVFAVKTHADIEMRCAPTKTKPAFVVNCPHYPVIGFHIVIFSFGDADGGSKLGSLTRGWILGDAGEGC